MAYGYIYETTNLIDGTKYIGKRETLKDINTYLGSGKHFKNALNKYGRESFKKRVLCFYDSKQELCEAEKYFIAVYRHFYGRDGMYNIADGGEGCGIKGKTLSEETKAKIKASLTGRKHTEEEKIKQSEAQKGRKTWNKGIPMSEETKKKQSDAHKGKCHTEETKKKQSDAHKGRKSCNRRQILQYDLEGNFIREWEYIGKAVKELNISQSCIIACCKYVYKYTHGFIFRYKKEETI